MSELEALVAALQAQTDAITRLAASNMELVSALAEADGDEDAMPARYMDGSPVL